MRVRTILLAAALVLTPLAAQAADLVVWWDKGYYAQEDKVLSEIIAAFEQTSGKQVEVTFYPDSELPTKIDAAIEAGQPPDFAYGGWVSENIARWAFNDRLADLTDTVGNFANRFDAHALDSVTLANSRTGQRGLYGLPVGRASYYFHVWESLLEQAGFTLADVPKEWSPFWSFWCDQVQPAVRKALGRDDIWGVGLNMSATSADTWIGFYQVMIANDADYVAPDGKLLLDDSTVRQKLAKAIDSYTSIYRKGCTPPDAVNWSTDDRNNKAFLVQMVIATPNGSLSIPNALKREQPDLYHNNVATVQWPLGPGGEPFPIWGQVWPAVVFGSGGNTATAKQFVRFLVNEGWLAHYLNFSGERVLPAMPELLEAPFWLDPNERHHMAAVMQVSLRPLAHNYAAVAGNWRHQLVDQEAVWAKAVHRIVTENISPEQAVDEAIARIKQILSE
jgi:multiple sugar transport system substrate-binding protein